VLGVKLIAGRNLRRADAGRTVIVINETMARKYWMPETAIGQTIVSLPAWDGWNQPGELEIVGVVQDFRKFLSGGRRRRPSPPWSSGSSRASPCGRLRSPKRSTGGCELRESGPAWRARSARSR
jgi:MacB-like periplasmic core domain